MPSCRGSFWPQGSNPRLLCLLHWQAGSYHECHLGTRLDIISTKEIALAPLLSCWLSGVSPFSVPSREFSEHPNATSHLPGSRCPQLLLCLPSDVTPPWASNLGGELTAPSGASALCWWSLLIAPLWPPLGHLSNVASALPTLPKASQGSDGLSTKLYQSAAHGTEEKIKQRTTKNFKSICGYGLSFQPGPTLRVLNTFGRFSTYLQM